MYCEKCGAKITEGARFCQICGNPVEPGSMQDQEAHDEIRPRRRKKGIKIFLIILIVVLLTGAGVGLGIYLYSRSSQDRDNGVQNKDEPVREGRLGSSSNEKTAEEETEKETESPTPALSRTREEELDEMMKTLGCEYLGGKSFPASFKKEGQYNVQTKEFGKAGVFGAVKEDFDGDGEKEYLLVSLGLGDEENDLRFRLHMMEQELGIWQEKAQAEVTAHEASYGSFTSPVNYDFFYKECEDGIRIYGETAGYAGHFADGMVWYLHSFRYEDGKLASIAEPVNLVGSDVEFCAKMDPELAYDSYTRQMAEDFRQEILDAGIQVTQVGYGTPVVSQDGNTVTVGRCRKEDHISQEESARYYQYGAGELPGLAITFWDCDQVPRNEIVQEEQPVSQSTHRYEIIIRDVTWQQAWDDCISRGGYLARFETEEEFQMILGEINRQGLGDKIFYLGAKRKGDSEKYYWYDQNEEKVGSRLNSEKSWVNSWWMEDEPSFQDGPAKENKVDMYYYKKEGQWVFNDIPNNVLSAVPSYAGRLAYICEYDN